MSFFFGVYVLFHGISSYDNTRKAGKLNIRNYKGFLVLSKNIPFKRPHILHQELCTNTKQYTLLEILEIIIMSFLMSCEFCIKQGYIKRNRRNADYVIKKTYT